MDVMRLLRARENHQRMIKVISAAGGRIVGNVDDEIIVEISEEGYNSVCKQLGVD